MSKLFWRKQLALLKRRLYLYPAPEPMPRTRRFWIALSLVTVLAATFALFYSLYLTRMQDAFLTPGEDMGIMDQALWSFTHGQLFHQTICNVVSDTNCYSLNGVSRFAIHFEPILFPTAIAYVFWPDPKVLMILQTLIVASGAFPAFWLARLRLRSELAGVAIAALYLLYPELQNAEAGYFHAVVLTSAFLMYLLYFLYTRRTGWVFVFALLAMACKEEIPLVIFMFGLWSIVFQRRWRCGLGLMGMAVAWVGLTLLVFHISSPMGRPLLASRYAYLGNGPLEIARNILLHPVTLIKEHIFDHAHLHYIRILFSPVDYLAFLAPWVLILAVPSIALNLFSTDPNMYQGNAQYNAEIVPILIFATIEALVVIIFVLQWIVKRVRERQSRLQVAQVSEPVSTGPRQNIRGLRLIGKKSIGNPLWLRSAALVVLLVLSLVGVLSSDRTFGVMPISKGFVWPQMTPHDSMAQHFIAMIPPDSSVSAQSSLVPHLSQRQNIYLFPYGVGSADYVFLDETSDPYPYALADYQNVVKDFLVHGDYGLVASGDGYLLLKHGLPAPCRALAFPDSSGKEALPAFCS